jgi:Transposase DDE domain
MDLSRTHAALSLFRHTFAELGKRFERVRCWTPERVGLALMMLVANPQVTSIAKLMPAWSSALLLPTTPSESSFIEARNKLAKLFPDAMRDLWQRLSIKALELIPVNRRTIGGLQWIAVDGSWAWLPHEAGIIKRWGQPKTKTSTLHYPQMLLVTALDVLTRIPLAAATMAHDGSERVGVRSFLNAFGRGMVLMADRGFPAHKLLFSVVQRGADLLWRMQASDANSWDCVYRFLNDRSKPRDQRVTLRLTPSEAGSDHVVEIEVRLIRRLFTRGRPKNGQTRETMVLMTTLLDEKEWPAERLVAMYERRWNIETWTRDVKIHFGLEHFHSRRDDLILQELHALMAWMTICSIVERNAYQRVERSRGKQDPEDPHRYQISPSNLYCACSRIFARLIMNPNVTMVLKESEIDLKWLDSTARRRRPNRSHPRVNKGPYGRW